MKINYNQIFSFAFACFLSYLMLTLMFSCSAQYHMAKFIKKGGNLNVKETTISIHDTLRINGKDSIIEKTIQVNCPEMQAPKTRFETRIEYRYKKSKDKIVYRTLYRTKKTASKS